MIDNSMFCPGCNSLDCTCPPPCWEEAQAEDAYVRGYDRGQADSPENRPSERWLRAPYNPNPEVEWSPSMHYLIKMQGELRPVNTTADGCPPKIEAPVVACLAHGSALVSEPATGRYRPPEALRAEHLAAEAEVFYRMRRVVSRQAEHGGNSKACEARRSAFDALAFSVRTCARTLAVPVRLDCGERHQKYLWHLVGSHAQLGDPLAFSEAGGGALAVVLGDDEFGDDVLGVFRLADAAWVTRLRGFGVAPYVGRVIGDDATWRLSLEVVVGHVGAAVRARRQALGRPVLVGGDGLAGPDLPSPSMA